MSVPALRIVPPRRRRGRESIFDRPLTPAQRQRRARVERRKLRIYLRKHRAAMDADLARLRAQRDFLASIISTAPAGAEQEEE